jgi:HSP90 family molecular chaperone
MTKSMRSSFRSVDKYGDIDLKAVNKTSTSEDLKDEAEPDKTEALKPLLEKMKATLGDRVKDVRASVRLADSPSCIVSDEEGALHADAADAARHGPEGDSRAQAYARDQSRSRDCEEAAGARPTTLSRKTPPGCCLIRRC